MKIRSLAAALALSITLLAGCGQAAPKPAETKPADTKPAATEPAKTDATTGASQVADEAGFVQKISKDNTNFMIIVNKDLTFTKDLIVEAGVKKGTDGKDAPNRAIAPGATDANHKVTARYTITVPNLVFAGENGKIEYGIVKGDVYVQAAGFVLTDATIDGNLYFASDDLKKAFKLDATSKVTGTTGVKTYTAK